MSTAKVADLVWEREDAADAFKGVPNVPQWIREWWIARAKVTFPNGWGVSVIQGPRIFPCWHEGLYEAAPITRDGLLVTREMVRGDAHAVERLMDEIESR